MILINRGNLVNKSGALRISTGYPLYKGTTVDIEMDGQVGTALVVTDSKQFSPCI